MSNTDQICFLPEPGDTNSFASSVAINDKYLVVGDRNANRVIVYKPDSQGHWYREREIYPPENSIHYQVGNGFGRDLWLERTTLMVDAMTQQPSVSEAIKNPQPDFYGKYLVQLDQQQEAVSISCPNDQEEGFVQFHILFNGKSKLVKLPRSIEQELSFSTIKLFNSFVVHNNLLLVCSPSPYKKGKGWLFNLKSLENPPIELTTENGYLGDTVALSDQFAVVGNSGIHKYSYDYLYHPETLIKSLNNDSSVVSDIQGKLSLEGNILAVMRPSLLRFVRSVALLQLFRLDEDATPHLILERKYFRRGEKCLTRAWIQNGWLITVYRIRPANSIELCLESLEQIISNSINQGEYYK